MTTLHNVRIFAAAYAGAMAGMQASDRVPKNTSVSNYLMPAAIAGAWALAFDAEWDDETTATILEVQMAQTLSADVWQERAPTVSTAAITPATYRPIVLPLIAMIAAADAYMAENGITIPAASGGGGDLAGDVISPSEDNRVTAIRGTDEGQPTVAITAVIAAANGQGGLLDFAADSSFRILGSGGTTLFDLYPQEAQTIFNPTRMQIRGADVAPGANTPVAGSSFFGAGRGDYSATSIDGKTYFGAGDGAHYYPDNDSRYSSYFVIDSNDQSQNAWRVKVRGTDGLEIDWLKWNAQTRTYTWGDETGSEYYSTLNMTLDAFNVQTFGTLNLTSNSAISITGQVAGDNAIRFVADNGGITFQAQQAPMFSTPSSANASAGGGEAMPATVAGYLNVIALDPVGGTPTEYRIPFVNPA